MPVTSAPPPTNKFFAIPTPPEAIMDPVVVLEDCVVSLESIAPANVEAPDTFTSSSSVCPSISTLPLASMFPVNVETPDTVNVVVVDPAPETSSPRPKVE